MTIAANQTNDGSASNCHWRFGVFTAAWSTGFLILVAATWRLWIGAANFAMVPLLESLVDAPLSVDWIALCVAAVACLSIGFCTLRAKKSSTHSSEPMDRTCRWLAVAVAAAMVLLFALNQHRLQPWAWQAFLFATITFVARTKRASINAARVVMIVIYFYSAIGKMDYQFAHGIGLEFLAVLTKLLGISLLPEPWMAALLPLGELVVAVLLLSPRTRKPGVLLAGVFHLTLIAMLGPAGMDHHAGVLIWNAINIGLVTILFWPHPSEVGARSVDKPTLKQHATSALENHPWLTAVMLLTIAMPLFPACDHWLAWGLYSPGHRRCELELVVWEDDPLPDDLRPYVSVGSLPISVKVDLGRLSLERTGAPIYPEARFQYGIARWIEREYQMQGRSIVTVDSKANRWTGQRTTTRIRNDSFGPENATEFFFNATPRR